MTEASGLSSAGVSVEPELLAEVVSHELAAMLQAGNYDAVKLLLEPVQPVDIAEAIGALPANLQAIAFRLLSKDEAISVYEYLDTATQQSLLSLLRSGEMREVMEAHGWEGALGCTVPGRVVRGVRVADAAELDDWALCLTDYGERYVSAVQRGRVAPEPRPREPRDAREVPQAPEARLAEALVRRRRVRHFQSFAEVRQHLPERF